MPAHKHCELLIPSSGCAKNLVGNALGQFLESYVINRVFTTGLVTDQ